MSKISLARPARSQAVEHIERGLRTFEVANALGPTPAAVASVLATRSGAHFFDDLAAALEFRAERYFDTRKGASSGKPSIFHEIYQSLPFRFWPADDRPGDEMRQLIAVTTDLFQPFEHDENMQAFEQEGSILVAVVDETYGRSEDEDWERDREAYRLGLEEEFGLRFEEGNIGPGADLPAFLTLLQSSVEVPAWLIAASIFFAGKPVSDNLDVWTKLAKRVRRFFTRPVYFNRYGAAVIAIDALIETLGQPPESLRLLSYRVLHLGEEGDLSKMERSNEIADPLATLYIGFIRHVFEVEAGGTMFRIGVDGRQATLLPLSVQDEN